MLLNLIRRIGRGTCWACAANRHGEMYDNTCPCCRRGHVW